MVKHHIEHYRRTIIVSAINIIHHIMVMKQQIYVFSTADVQMTLRWAMEKLGHEKRVLEEGTRIKIQQLLDL